jgi:hypothetical protein
LLSKAWTEIGGYDGQGKPAKEQRTRVEDSTKV